MVTQRQLIANRQNGKKGGPKTDTGKAVVRLNAMKHGLLSQQVVLPGEDGDAFEELRVALMGTLQPQGKHENKLFDIIVSTYWRLARVVTLETCFMQAQSGVSSCDYSVKAHKNAVNYQFAGTSKIANLNRYETSLERRLYRALHELQLLQMARNGKEPPSPLVIDVDVSQAG